MKKIISLIKYTIKGDLSLFKLGDNLDKKKKILGSIVLIILLMYSMFVYAYQTGVVLKPLNLTYIMLSIWMFATITITFFESIYKSQGFLFEAKDDDLLLSLPISKTNIILIRILKLIFFEYLVNTIILIPTFAVYIYFENPSISFYFISLLCFILLPLIPTILGSLLGYLIVKLSLNNKHKTLTQTIYSLFFAFLIMYFSFNMQNYLASLSSNANIINNNLINIYYPLKLYNELILNFDFKTLIIFLIINILPFILAIYLLSLNYFKLLSKIHKNNLVKSSSYLSKQNSILKTLIIKEKKRFFTLPVYVYNTVFGLLLLIILVIVLKINTNGVIDFLLNNSPTDKDLIINNLPLYYLAFILFILSMTSITSSSISLEGSSFDYLKSLPINVSYIMTSKLYFSLFVIYPLLFFANILFMIFFNPSLIMNLFIVILSILIPILISIFGLIINLAYPKLHYNNETEVVKQSMSTFISIFGGMGFVALIIALYNISLKYFSINISITLIIIFISILILVLKHLLLKECVKLYPKLTYL